MLSVYIIIYVLGIVVDASAAVEIGERKVSISRQIPKRSPRIQGKIVAVASSKSRYQSIGKRKKRERSVEEKLILKRPAIFQNLSESVSWKSNGNLEEHSPQTFYHAPNTPSPFYEVPPPQPAQEDIPSQFYQVPGNTSTSNFNDEPPPTDQGDRLELAESAEDQKNSVILSKPFAIASIAMDTESISSQSLPSIGVSISSNQVSLASSLSTNKISSLSRNSALLVALLLSLIPTMAVSIPFFIPSVRQGRRVESVLVPLPRKDINLDADSVLIHPFKE